MKNIIVGLILLFSVNAAGAADGKDWKGYYDNLLKGLKSKVQKKFESKTRVSAVAAVRGAKQGSDAEAVYWKGGVSEKGRVKLAEEKKALTDAVQLVVDGKMPEGRAALDKFIKDYPESLYAADAREALANLPVEEAKPAEGKAPEAKPAEEKIKAAEIKPAEAKPAEVKVKAAEVKPSEPKPAETKSEAPKPEASK